MLTGAFGWTAPDGALMCCPRSACPFEKSSRIVVAVQPCLATTSSGPPLFVCTCTKTLLALAPHRGSFPRLHCRLPRNLGDWGLHVITWGWLESHSFSSDRPASYSSIAWCARSAGCAPSAALASATSPSQSLAQTHPCPSPHTCARPPVDPSFSAPTTTQRASPALSPPIPLPPRRLPACACACPSVARMRLALANSHARHGWLRHQHHVVPGDADAHAECPRARPAAHGHAHEPARPVRPALGVRQRDLCVSCAGPGAIAR